MHLRSIPSTIWNDIKELNEERKENIYVGEVDFPLLYLIDALAGLIQVAVQKNYKPDIDVAKSIAYVLVHFDYLVSLVDEKDLFDAIEERIKEEKAHVEKFKL
jgi:hypothetical protein